VQLVQGQGLQRVHGEQGEDQQTSDRPEVCLAGGKN
jgi:hypothetical protein